MREKRNSTADLQGPLTSLVSLLLRLRDVQLREVKGLLGSLDHLEPFRGASIRRNASDADVRMALAITLDSWLPWDMDKRVALGLPPGEAEREIWHNLLLGKSLDPSNPKDDFLRKVRSRYSSEQPDLGWGPKAIRERLRTESRTIARAILLSQDTLGSPFPNKHPDDTSLGEGIDAYLQAVERWAGQLPEWMGRFVDGNVERSDIEQSRRLSQPPQIGDGRPPPAILPLVPARGATAIVGPGGVGKSWALAALARNLLHDQSGSGSQRRLPIPVNFHTLSEILAPNEVLSRDETLAAVVKASLQFLRADPNGLEGKLPPGWRPHLLLDGLDEVELPRSQERSLRALLEHGDLDVTIGSRAGRWHARPLCQAQVQILLPFTRRQLAEFFTSLGVREPDGTMLMESEGTDVVSYVRSSPAIATLYALAHRDDRAPITSVEDLLERSIRLLIESPWREERTSEDLVDAKLRLLAACSFIWARKGHWVFIPGTVARSTVVEVCNQFDLWTVASGPPIQRAEDELASTMPLLERRAKEAPGLTGSWALPHALVHDFLVAWHCTHDPRDGGARGLGPASSLLDVPLAETDRWSDAWRMAARLDGTNDLSRHIMSSGRDFFGARTVQALYCLGDTADRPYWESLIDACSQNPAPAALSRGLDHDLTRFDPVVADYIQSNYLVSPRGFEGTDSWHAFAGNEYPKTPLRTVIYGMPSLIDPVWEFQRLPGRKQALICAEWAQLDLATIGDHVIALQPLYELWLLAELVAQTSSPHARHALDIRMTRLETWMATLVQAILDRDESSYWEGFVHYVVAHCDSRFPRRRRPTIHPRPFDHYEDLHDWNVRLTYDTTWSPDTWPRPGIVADLDSAPGIEVRLLLYGQLMEAARVPLDDAITFAEHIGLERNAPSTLAVVARSSQIFTNPSEAAWQEASSAAEGRLGPLAVAIAGKLPPGTDLRVTLLTQEFEHFAPRVIRLQNGPQLGDFPLQYLLLGGRGEHPVFGFPIPETAACLLAADAAAGSAVARDCLRDHIDKLPIDVATASWFTEEWVVAEVASWLDDVNLESAGQRLLGRTNELADMRTWTAMFLLPDHRLAQEVPTGRLECSMLLAARANCGGSLGREALAILLSRLSGDLLKERPFRERYPKIFQLEFELECAARYTVERFRSEWIDRCLDLATDPALADLLRGRTLTDWLVRVSKGDGAAILDRLALRFDADDPVHRGLLADARPRWPWTRDQEAVLERVYEYWPATSWEGLRRRAE